MLSFIVKGRKSGELPDELEIQLDSAGLETLLAQLGFLKDGRSDHIDLLDQLWGGTHLDSGTSNQNLIPIRHVKILLK